MVTGQDRISRDLKEWITCQWAQFLPNIWRPFAQRINGTQETTKTAMHGALEQTPFRHPPPHFMLCQLQMDSFQIGTTHSLGTVKTCLQTPRGKESIRYTTLTQETSIKPWVAFFWLPKMVWQNADWSTQSWNLNKNHLQQLFPTEPTLTSSYLTHPTLAWCSNYGNDPAW